MSRIGPGRRRLALAAHAVALVLAFPHALPGGGAIDLGIGVAWLVPATLVLGIDGLSPLRAAGAAFLASVVGHAVLFHWFFVVTWVYGGMPLPLALVSPLLPALYASSFPAAFAALWSWHQGVEASRPGRALAVGAATWAVLDWLRAHWLGGFPWGSLGYALHADVPLLGITRWTGVYGLSFLAAATGVAIALWLRDRDAPTRRWLGAVVCAVLLAHGLGAGLQRMGPGRVETVRIAAVQGNVDQGEKWDAARRERILGDYVRLSEAAAERGARWIVWPETAVPGLLDADRGLVTRLGALARRTDAVLVVGGMGIEPDATGLGIAAFFDSAFLVGRDGRIHDRYDKTHLVPFGEYVPLRDLLGRFFQSLARGLSPTDVQPGPEPRLMLIEQDGADAPPIRIGVPICYELLFPHVVRRFVEARAGVLLAITNDAWYGRTGAPHQFLAMTALRSAENGRWTVRAANTGISAIIDARGRVRAKTPLFEEAILVEDVPVVRSGTPTFYARYGDVFAGACWAGPLWVLVAPLWRRGVRDGGQGPGRPANAPADGAETESAR